MSDLIDREEVIKALRLEYPMMPLFKENQKEWAIKTEGYRKAEEVIMRLPGEVIFESIPSAEVPTTMTGVIDAIREAEYRGYMKAVEDRPQGEWIEVTNGRGGHECSECHDYAPSFQNGAERLSHFCPNCGADMRERKDFQVIVNGNCTKCGKPLSGNRIFICEDCEEQSKESSNERLGGERRSHKGNR